MKELHFEFRPGNRAGNLTGLPEIGLLGLGGGIADNVYSGLNFESAVDKQSENFAESAAAGGFDPSTIDYDFNATPAPIVAPALDQYDLAATESDRFTPAPVVAPVVKKEPAPVVVAPPPAPVAKKKKKTSSALKKEMSKQQKNVSAVKSGTYKRSMGGF